MPKENIYCEANRGDSPDESWRAEVQWSGGKDGNYGFVMVGTVNPNSQFNWQQVDQDNSEGQFKGYFVHLDRAGINRMIRTLRRARDTAYGADA